MSNDHSYGFVYDAVPAAMRVRHAAMLCKEAGSSAPARLWRVSKPRTHLKADIRSDINQDEQSVRLSHM